MKDHAKTSPLLTKPKEEYELFKAGHQKRMAELEKKERELREEYTRLLNEVYGINVKMKVL